MKHRGSVLLSLLALGVMVFGQEGGLPIGETVAMEAPVFCESSLEVLRAEIVALWDPAAVNVYINCLAFGAERRLETAIVSAMPRDGTPGTRFVVSCQNNALFPMQSAQPARRFNLTQQEFTACVECRDVATAADICEPCPVQCERCAPFSAGVLCTECNELRLLNQYTPGAELTPEQIETVRERLEQNGQEEVCTDDPVPDPAIATSFSCVASCPDNGNRTAPSEKDSTCYACGLEYCVECELGAETGGRNECRVCLQGTVLFDGECYSCPLALIARTAILQEAEEQAEQAIQRQRQIELAVALPIVSVLIIATFLSLAVYAHYRYPHNHVSIKGHKEHGTKPDVFTAEQAASTSRLDEPEPSHRFR